MKTSADTESTITSLDKASFLLQNSTFPCPVGWSCRIHRLLLCREIRPPPHECHGYASKQSDGEVPVMLELWGMPSLSGPLWSGVVAPDRVLSKG